MGGLVVSGRNFGKAFALAIGRALVTSASSQSPMAPRNAAQQIYLPLLKAKLEAPPSAGYTPVGTPPRRRRPGRRQRKLELRELARRNFEWVRANGVPLQHLSAHGRRMAGLRQALAA